MSAMYYVLPNLKTVFWHAFLSSAAQIHVVDMLCVGIVTVAKLESLLLNV